MEILRGKLVHDERLVDPFCALQQTGCGAREGNIAYEVTVRRFYRPTRLSVGGYRTIGSQLSTARG